jgi:hypothetical protein
MMLTTTTMSTMDAIPKIHLRPDRARCNSARCPFIEATASGSPNAMARKRFPMLQSLQLSDAAAREAAQAQSRRSLNRRHTMLVFSAVALFVTSVAGYAVR